jgi:hypothetical protein
MRRFRLQSIHASDDVKNVVQKVSNFLSPCTKRTREITILTEIGSGFA